MKVKKDDPKKAFGDKKVPMHEIPPVAEAFISCAFYDGDLKYGFRNWRRDHIEARTYIAATLRHLQAWAECEELAPDSKLPHLGHAAACLCLLMDAQANKTLIDNRVKGEFAAVLTALEPWMKERNLKAAVARKKAADEKKRKARRK